MLSTGQPKFRGANVKRTSQMMLDTCSPEKATALAAALKRNGTWVCPTLVLLRMFGFSDDATFRNDPRVKYLG